LRQVQQLKRKHANLQLRQTNKASLTGKGVRTTAIEQNVF